MNRSYFAFFLQLINFSISYSNTKIKDEENNFILLKSNDLKVATEKVTENFEKCKKLYHEFLKKELSFSLYQEALMCNLDCLENVWKYLIFNELFFQKLGIILNKDDFKKYLKYVFVENNFKAEVVNFEILTEILNICCDNDRDLTSKDFFTILFLINSFLDKDKKEIMFFYKNLKTEKIIKIREILNNDQNFLIIVKILMRWKCDLNSNWLNKSFLENLLIVEDHFQKKSKDLSYLEFEALNNKQISYNLPIQKFLIKDLEENKEYKKTKKNKLLYKQNILNNKEKEEKKEIISVLKLETKSGKKRYIIESSKNDDLIINVKKRPYKSDQNLYIKQHYNEHQNHLSDKKNTKDKNDNTQITKNEKILYRGVSLVVLLFFIAI